MFYIKLENGSPIGYPIIEQNLLDAFQISEITESFLAENDFAKVERISIAPGERVVQELGFEMGSDGIVRPILQTEEMTQSEKVDAWIRRHRDVQLARSDWTQMADSPLSAEKKAEWAAYRQQLRDMTSLYADIQDPSEIVPPTEPSK